MDDKEIFDNEEQGPELRALQDKAYTLWEDLDRESHQRKIPHAGEAELFLRVVMALLKGENEADEYIQTKLRCAVGGLGFDLQVIPKENCGRSIYCPHHDHSDDIVVRAILRERAARIQDKDSFSNDLFPPRDKKH